MPAQFDPYHRWLGIPPEKQPPSHYALLAIEPFEGSADVIESAADQRMAHLRNYQAGEHSDLSQKLLNEVAAAKICLLNSATKAAYDRKLREKTEAARPVVPKAVSMQPRPVAPVGRPTQVASDEPTSMASFARRRRSQFGPIVAGGVIAAVVIGGLILWALNSDRPPDDGGDVAQRSGKNGTPEEPPGDTSPDPTVEQPDNTPPAPSDGAPPENVGPNKNPPDGDPAVLPETDPGEDDPPTTPPGDDTHPPEPDSDQPPPKQEPQRRPVPSTAAQDEVTRQLDEVYKFADVKTAAEKLALVEQLMKLADEAKENAAEQFVLLRKAMELAAAAGDAVLMLEAVDAIAAGFEIDALAVKQKVLPQAAKAATDAEQIGRLVEGSLAVVDEAMASHRYDVALEVVQATTRACQQSIGRDYRKQISGRREEVQKLHTAWQEFRNAMTTLETSPDDAAANLAAGRWHYLFLNDWQEALPYLSKCRDAALKSAATLELASPADATQQVAAGDAWWTAAETAEDEAKPVLMHRAGYWYEQAQPNVKSALVKGKLAQRLGEIAKVELPAAQLAGVTADRNQQPQGREVTADALVLWNTHNAKYKNRGALMCNVWLGRNGKVVWSARSILVNWAAPVDPRTVVRLPKVKFDVLRVEITKAFKDGGGLSEIEVYQGNVNIARGLIATASASQNTVPGNVTDGITQSERHRIGYWLLPDNTPGWIEVDFSREEIDAAPFLLPNGQGVDPGLPPPADAGTTGEPAPLDGQPLIPSAGSERTEPRPPSQTGREIPRGQWVELLGPVDVAKDGVAGKWTRAGEAVGVSPSGMATLMLPVRIEGSYELVVESTGTAGTNSVVVIPPVGSRQCYVMLNGWKGTASGIGQIDGRSGSENSTTKKPGPLRNGRRNSILLRVQLAGDRADIKVLLDRNPYTSWSGKQASLSLPESWGRWDSDRPVLGASDSSVTFHSVRFRLLSGTASWVRPVVALPSQGEQTEP
ncbi:MAG: hypothetical protein HQ567_33695 [Candidatus Nealsonbacteria bacterium]|nr:hypothetical protein [Candidatus Nealsonbacteria bacterium]